MDSARPEKTWRCSVPGATPATADADAITSAAPSAPSVLASSQARPGSPAWKRSAAVVAPASARSAVTAGGVASPVTVRTEASAVLPEASRTAR